jgi:serine/threonine-protein kinase
MTVSAGGVELPADVAQRFGASKPLHAGVTSVLFEGTDPTTGRAVIVKVLRDSAIASTAERQRILRELQKLTQVRHAALGPVLATGESNGMIWLARERVEGAPLSERLATVGSFPAAQVARIAAGVSAALGELHRNGVLHRDVRPGHVLVDAAGQVRVLDAAVARTTRLPDGRMLSGTPGYVAPEAIGGKLVSFRSDLYSLGALVFELLHGAPPYGLPDTPNVLQHQTDRDAPPARMGTPVAMANLVASLLSREPRERPFSAQQLERQLEPLASADAAENPDEAAATMATSMEELANAANEDATTVVPPMSEISKSRVAPPPRPFEDPPTQISEPSSPAISAPRPAAGMPPRAGGTGATSAPRPGAPPTAGPPRKATMIGVAPLGPSAPTAPIPGGALALAASPEIIPASRPMEGSGQRPAPIDANEFDDAMDTVVTEDSRIFGVPEVAGGSPHGSAVPPLPDAVAARVLTGSVKQAPPASGPMGNGPATASMPAVPSPQIAAGARPGPPPAMPAGAFGMPGPAAPPPTAPPGMAAPAAQPAWNAQPSSPAGWQSAQPAWTSAPAPANTMNQPPGAGGWSAPTAPGMGPSVAPQGFPPPQPVGYAPQVPPAFGAQLASPNQATAPFQGQSAPMGFGPQPGYPPQFAGGATYPGYAHPAPRRGMLPWILAGIGVAAIAGASGYFFASRDRAPTVNTAPVPIASAPAPSVTSAAGTASPPTASARTPTAMPNTPNDTAAARTPTSPPAHIAPPPSAAVVQPTVAIAPAQTPIAPSVQNAPVAAAAVAPPDEPRSAHSHHHHGSSDSAASTSAPTRGSSLSQARAAYQHRDYAQARTLASAAVHEQPSSADAHALLAEILGRGNDTNGALNEWRAASRLSPRNTEYLHRIANIQLDRFDRAGATATLRQILQITPNDTAAQRQLASLGGGAANNTAHPANNTAAHPANNTAAHPASTPSPNRTGATRSNNVPFVPTFGAPAPRGGSGRAGSIRR